MLSRIARKSAKNDKPPLATSGDGILTALAQDTLYQSYTAAGSRRNYDPSQGQVAGITPFSYAAGAMLAAADHQLEANLLAGHFGPEAALIADAADRSAQLTIAGSDSLPAQATLLAAADEVLIGEELFAGGAYLQANPAHQASLAAQDALRWLIILLILAGCQLETYGHSVTQRRFPIFLLILAVAGGGIVLMGYWVDLPALTAVRNVLLRWAATLTGVAVLLGILNLLTVHWLKIIQPREGRVFPGHADCLCHYFPGGCCRYAHRQLVRMDISLHPAPGGNQPACHPGSPAGRSRRPVSCPSPGIFSPFCSSAPLSCCWLLPPTSPGLISRSCAACVTGSSKFQLSLGARGLLLGIGLGVVATGLRILLGADRPYER